MKNPLTLLFTLITLTVFGQAPKTEKNTSNAEKFSERSGTLIQQEFIDIGLIKKCKVKVVRLNDLISTQKSSALRFEQDVASTYSSDTKIAVLDSDEIDGLIKSLKIIQDNIYPNTPANYTEVSFRSRSGFEAGCYYGKNGWSLYMKLERFDSKSYVFLEKNDLPTLLDLLAQAKAKL